MPKWSVIACDQHTSEPEYWDRLSDYIGNAPSTLRMMLPEAYLPLGRKAGEENACMLRYINDGVFRCLKDSFIYIERTLSSGAVRRGLIGLLDLNGDVLATEGVVSDRLPPRIAIRKEAPLEMPHALVFTEDNVFSSVEKGELLYDFELNSGGGHIQGWLAEADGSLVKSAAIGDGNHSLAAARLCGDGHALVELLDIRDDSIVFEPIHRVIFSTDSAFHHKIDFSRCSNYAEIISSCDEYCRNYVAAHGGCIDYIHGDETAARFGEQPGCISILLPPLKKDELFDHVRKFGPYPKKSFSIGQAADKRYYLECRKL